MAPTLLPRQTAGPPPAARRTAGVPTRLLPSRPASASGGTPAPLKPGRAGAPFPSRPQRLPRARRGRRLTDTGGGGGRRARAAEERQGVEQRGQRPRPHGRRAGGELPSPARPASAAERECRRGAAARGWGRAAPASSGGRGGGGAILPRPPGGRGADPTTPAAQPPGQRFPRCGSGSGERRDPAEKRERVVEAGRVGSQEGQNKGLVLSLPDFVCAIQIANAPQEHSYEASWSTCIVRKWKMTLIQKSSLIPRSALYKGDNIKLLVLHGFSKLTALQIRDNSSRRFAILMLEALPPWNSGGMCHLGQESVFCPSELVMIQEVVEAKCIWKL